MNYMAIGGYNRPLETSRTITRFCGYGFFVTAPENQFGEFLERKRKSLRVPDWAWFTGGELSPEPSCYKDLAGTGSAYGAQVHHWIEGAP